MRSCTRLLLAPGLILSAFLVPVLTAQEITGNIRGTITDPTGAVVPGATVILVDSAKNLEIRRVTSNKSGEYVAPLLPVGTYEIDVEAPASSAPRRRASSSTCPTGSKRTSRLP